MSREDIIRMAQKAGIKGPLPARQGFRMSASPDRLRRFADLVAAAEREACAKEERMLEEIDELRQALEGKQEPFEYWNAVEGWVKIDEVREHFDAIGCGTIYKSAGEGRVPLYTAPQKAEQEPVQPPEWVGLTNKDIDDCYFAARQPDFDIWAFAAEIEEVLKQKNAWGNHLV